MHKLAISTLSLFALSTALSAQNIGVGVVTALAPNNNPNLGAAVINQDASAVPNSIAAIEQIELRSIGGGSYRCVVTATFVGGSDTSLVTGILVMAANPPLWLPDNDVAALNVAGAATDEFQGSLSADGLTFVWDNYRGAVYPNSAISGTTFVCRRASTAVPFSVNDVWPVIGVPAGGVDPHIAQELANGNILMTYLDAAGDISKIEVNPANGQTANSTLAVANTGRTGWVFSHSPYAQRDGAGRPRGLTFSEFVTGGSDGVWTEDLNNTGTPQIVANQIQGGTAFWFANPAVVGGTFNWATAAAGYGDPSQLEATCLCNTDATSGSGSIVCYAPIRPAQPFPGFFSGVFLGIPSGAPYQIAPVVGDIGIFPFGNPLSGGHDPATGRLEFGLSVPAALLGTGPFAMQMISIDLGTGAIFSGNTARLDF